MPLLLMFMVFYFLLIRPQQKRARQQAEMLSRLKKGDVVITQGGLIGTIAGLTDSELTIEVAEKMRVRVLRSQVGLYGVADPAGNKAGPSLEKKDS